MNDRQNFIAIVPEQGQWAATCTLMYEVLQNQFGMQEEGSIHWEALHQSHELHTD